MTMSGLNQSQLNKKLNRDVQSQSKRRISQNKKNIINIGSSLHFEKDIAKNIKPSSMKKIRGISQNGKNR